jgi:Malectin domain/Bacterial TSP3 repeat
MGLCLMINIEGVYYSALRRNPFRCITFHGLKLFTPASLCLFGVRVWLFSLLLLIFATSAFATQVTLQWDPNTEPALAGYKVYYGYASRQYNVNVDVGKSTKTILSGLDDVKVYYFTVTAYDSNGNESEYANEVSYNLSTADSDKDALSDWDEISLYRTAPNRADTDGDGLSDGDEVEVHRTDPTRADSDGDGVSDGVEVSKGANPLDPRSIPVSDEAVLAVNAGGPQYDNAADEVYDADADFSGGETYTTTAAIAGTQDDRLYQSERYGNFSYNVPMENGDYEVTLKFAEIYFANVGQRVFNVSLEGKTVISKLDLVAKVGPKTAYDVVVPVTVSDGVLNIGFQSVINNAKVSAIKVTAK